MTKVGSKNSSSKSKRLDKIILPAKKIIAHAARKLAAAALLGAAWHAHAAPLIRVIDGDTIVVRHDNRALHLRVANINTAELRDEGGIAARDFTAALCHATDITWQRVAIDRYHRTVAHVWCGEDNLAHAIKAAGHHRKRSR